MPLNDQRLQELAVAARRALNVVESTALEAERATAELRAVAAEAKAIYLDDDFYPALAFCRARDRIEELADELEEGIRTDGSPAMIAEELADAVELLELGVSHVRRFEARGATSVATESVDA